MPKTTRLKVECLPSIMTSERLKVLFGNKRRHGGGRVVNVKIDEKQMCAVITFETSDAIDIIMARGSEIDIDGAKLKLSPLDVETIKVHVKDTNLSKEICIVYLKEENIETRQFDECTMILDGIQGFLYVDVYDQEDARKLCQKKFYPGSIFTAVEMATASDLTIHHNLLFVRGQCVSPVESFFDKVKFHISDRASHYEEQADPHLVILTFDIETIAELADIAWEIPWKFRDQHLKTAPVPIPKPCMEVVVPAQREGVSEELDELDTGELILLEKTQLLQHIQKKLDTTITTNIKEKKILLKGYDKASVDQSKIEILNKLRDFKSTVVPNLKQSQMRLLKTEILQLNLNSYIEENNLEVHIEYKDGSLKAVHSKQVNPKDVADIVSSHCAVENIPVDRDLSHVFSSKLGKEFLLSLCNEKSESNDINTLSIVEFDHVQSYIVITASSKLQNVLKEKVEKFLVHSKVETMEVKCSSDEQVFIEMFLKDDFSNILEHAQSEATIVQKKENKFVLKGPSNFLRKWNIELTRLKDRINIKPFTLEMFGINEFLRMREGREIMESISKAKKCLFVLKSKEGAAATVQGKPVLNPPRVIAACKVDNYTINILQDDILGLQVDAIVNPLTSFQQCKSVLMKAIIAKGGSEIQTELNSASDGYPAEPVLLTTGGKLTCKHIIHFQCPTFATDSVSVLEKRLYDCLDRAKSEKCTSIAFTLAGTGELLKFSALVSATSLLNAIKSHMELEEPSSLSSIFLCDMKSENVQQLISRCEFHLKSKLEVFDKVQEDCNKDVNPELAKSSTQRPMKKKDFGNIKVEIVENEIHKCQTDVIVTTVHKSLDLTRGLIAKSVLHFGGTQIQDELSATYSSQFKEGEFAQTSGGNLSCSHIFHACLPKWDRRNDSQLTSLVTNMLQCADRLEGVETISFCALGTGKQGYPPDTVAHTIMDSITQFTKDCPNNSIKSVSLVIHPKDKPVLQAFKAVLDGGHSLETTEDQSCVNYGSLKFVIVQGNITTETCDAIVCGLKNSMDLSASGAVSQAILKTSGGSDIQDDVNAKSQEMIQAGVVVTSSHGMPYSNIIFVSMEMFATKWNEGVTAVLTEANKQGFTSLAMPALGTGARKADILMLKKQILGAIEEFGQQSGHTLKNLRLVIFDQKVHNAFLGHSHQGRNSPSKGTKPPVATKPEKADLLVYYLNAESCSAAQDLEYRCKKAFLTENLRKDYLDKLSDHEFTRLMKAGLEKQVQVTIHSGRIVLSGFSKENIQIICSFASELITCAVERHYQEQIQAMDMAIQWQFFSNGKWNNFDQMMNLKIESAYKKELPKVQVKDSKKRAYSVDLKQMKEFALHSSGRAQLVGDVQRSKVAEEKPKTWAPMSDSETTKLVELTNRNHEYNEVHKLFQTGSLQVKKIERIQNKFLYDQYSTKRRSMESKNQTRNEIEKRLFHGTDAGAVPLICENGFNRSLAGKNATAYGAGVYFSESSQYSSGYAQPDANADRRMFLARVLVGESIQSTSSMKALPNKPGTLTPYDSGKNGHMYIIFHDAQMYPEYLITFSA